MISLLCQKSCGGTINLDRNALHILRNGDTNEDNNHNNDSDVENQIHYRKRPTNCNYEQNTPSDLTKPSVNVKHHFGRSTKTTDDRIRPTSCVVIKFDNSNDRVERRISAKKLEQVQEWFNEQTTKKNNYINSRKGTKKISLHQEFNHKLYDEYNLNKDLEQKIAENELHKQRKKELIYKDWLVNVSHPIQSEINKNLQSTQNIASKMQRDLNYIQYLEQVNQRGCSYQDDYDPKEYDPLNLINLKAKVSKNIKDSTLVQPRKAENEQKLIANIPSSILSARSKPPLPTLFHNSRSRTEINWDAWNREKFRNVLSAERTRSTKKCNPERNNSKFEFDWCEKSDSSFIVECKPSSAQCVKSSENKSAKKEARVKFQQAENEPSETKT